MVATCHRLTLCRQAIPSFPHHSVAVKYATEHRCGVRVRGPGLSDHVSGTDPLKDQRPLRTSVPLDASAEALQTARLVNQLSLHMTEKLQEHPINRERIQQGKPPANCVLLRGCGARVQVPTFWERHGLAAFMIAPTCLIRGLGASLEMDIIDVPGATGDYFTDLSAKADCALRAMGEGRGPRGLRGRAARPRTLTSGSCTSRPWTTPAMTRVWGARGSGCRSRTRWWGGSCGGWRSWRRGVAAASAWSSVSRAITRHR